MTQLEIKLNILSKDPWLYRAILAIYDRQTEEEKVSEATLKHNGIGFNGVDAKLLSSYAKQLKISGMLSFKQRAWARKKILKYVGQLQTIAKEKENVIC